MISFLLNWFNIGSGIIKAHWFFSLLHLRHLLVLSEDVLPSQKFDCFAMSAFYCELILLILVEPTTLLQSTVSDSCTGEGVGVGEQTYRERDNKSQGLVWDTSVARLLACRIYVLYQCCKCMMYDQRVNTKNRKHKASSVRVANA